MLIVLFCNKRYDFQALIHKIASNFIAITADNLDDYLFLPTEYTVHCKDRNCHGGGVMIAVSSMLSCRRQDLE